MTVPRKIGRNPEFVHRKVADEEVLARGTEVTFEVLGESMRPTPLPGDRITVAPADAGNLRRGCRVACRGDGCLVVHRYLGTLPDGNLRTAGDAVDHRDAPVPPENLLGRVVAVERSGKPVRPRTGLLESLRWELHRIPAWVRRRIAFLP